MSTSKGARRATAIEYAITALAARSLPEKKLREKLDARYGNAEVELAIERLRELRMVDDAAWAERFARDRFERLGRGRHRVQRDLLQRGIPEHLVRDAVEKVFDEQAERAKACEVLAGIRRTLAGGSAGQGAELAAPGEDLQTDRRAPESRRSASGMDERRAAEKLNNRVFRRMLARGFSASLVRDLLAVS